MSYIKPIFVLTILFSLIFVFGCSNTEEDSQTKDNQLNFDLIASEKSLPTDFDETVFKRDTTPYFVYFIKKVVNQSEFEETWNLYGLESKTPKVDFSNKDVFFIGVHESGSCPYEIENINLNPDKKDITVSLSKSDGDCTSDATPRTFVIEFSKEVSKDLKNVVIVESGTETTVPIGES